MKKILLIISGVLCMALGIVGIVVPILPTTPFVLVAGICFSVSSPRLYKKLMRSKYFSAYINNYRYKTGIPKAIKIRSIIFLWILLLISAAVFRKYYIWIILGAVGAAVTTHILLLKTKKKNVETIAIAGETLQTECILNDVNEVEISALDE